jgi:3-oxoacyl-[acyl-carrier-protein] synthase II
MLKKKRIVITGLGIFSPLGVGIRDYWNSLLKRTFPIKKIDIFSTKEFKCKYAFQIGNFEFNKYFKELRSKYIPRSTKFLLISAKTALEDAGLHSNGYYSKEHIGVFTASRYGSGDASYEFYKNVLLYGPNSVDPMAFPAAIIIYASSYLGLINKFKGPNVTFSSGSNAGLEAVNFASSLIRQGDIKAAIVSGLNDLYIAGYAHLNSKGVLYRPNKRKGYRIGIFDINREGYILGENASTIVLENILNAKDRKGKIYAEVLGYSTNFGKSEDSYEKVIRGAIENSGLSPIDIDLCLLNANGIRSIDAMEIIALKKIFKANLDNIHLVAVKENNGECEEASGILQVLTAAKAIYEKTIPPSVYRYGTSTVGGIKIKYNLKRENITNVLINSFNLEGNNASLVIKEVKRDES